MLFPVKHENIADVLSYHITAIDKKNNVRLVVVLMFS